MIKFYVVLFSIFTFTMTAFAEEKDPYLWLEDVESPQALEWVKKENDRSLDDLHADPHFAPLEQDLRTILLATDRVAYGSYDDGFFYNYWQDKTNVKGLWRKTTKDEYRKTQPQWEVLLDLDALSKAEGKNWVWKGAPGMRGSNRVLVQLSDGGKDAVTVREYDVEKKKFVSNGFVLPEAKSRIGWIDEDHVFVATDFGPGSLSDSGYPRILKKWKRGTPLTSAETVLEADPKDMSVAGWISEHPDGKHTFVTKVLNFYESEVYWYDSPTGMRRIPIPTNAEFLGIFKGKFLFQLRTELVTESGTLPAGAVAELALDSIDAKGATLILAPHDRMSIQGVVLGRDSLFVSVLENVRGKLLELQPDAKAGWISRTLAYPDHGVVNIDSYDVFENVMTVGFENFVTPYTQYWQENGATPKIEQLKQSPSRFDATDLEVVQNEAISRDGTRVPYFLIKKKGLVLDGTNPTLLYGYGGFEISETPHYLSGIGKTWLERGGVYALANIRGGGEFGPKWHQAALKENRQRAYDDFIAIGEDLITSKVTSPRHLGIMGGSNGGLLVGAVMVQRPELFNAVISQVPLLDMVRYHKLLAGASWMGEYGNPEDPKMCEAILKYSPYQNLRKDGKYPHTFFVTSTKDDRVHPGHARKMAARMKEQGHTFSYFENMDGGHAASANLEERIHRSALEYTFLWKQLGKP